jgi:hypothetical protein
VPLSVPLPVSLPAPLAGPRRSAGRQWVTLPPLAVTVSRTAPLVAGPPPVRPPLPGARTVSGPDVAPAAGSVTGLARIQPQAPEPAGPLVPAEPVPVRPMVHRRVRNGPAPRPAAMVEATGGYVGEAREPAVPHRAPGWMRYVPEWLNQGNQSADPEPPAPKPALPPPPRIAEPVVPTASPVSTVPPVSTVEGPPVHPRRRPSLGQSRRLGLGAPLKPGEPATAEPSAPTAEPATAAPSGSPVSPADGPADGDDAEDDSPGPPPQPPPLHHPRPTDPAPSPSPPAAAQSKPASPPVPAADSVRSPVPTTASASAPPPVPARRPDPAPVPVVRPATPAAEPAEPATLAHRARSRQAHPAVPPDLASALRPGHQVDVSTIPVHRGPEVAAEARALGARAFARGGEVFLPADAGSLDTPRARGLLAHELVHAVQQRTLGTTLPAPDSPAGRALEAEAVAAEHAHSGHAARAPLVHPSLTQVIGQAARTVGVQLAPLVPQTFEPPAPPRPAQSTSDAPAGAVDPAEPLSPPARREIDLIAESRAIRTLEEWTAPEPDRNGEPAEDPEAGTPAAPPGFDHAAQDGAVAEQILQVVNVERAAAGQPALTTLDAPTMAMVRRTVAEQSTETVVGSMVVAQAVAGAHEPARPAAAPPVAEPVAPPPTPAAPEPARPPAPAPVATSAVPDETPIEVDRIDLEALAARLYDRLRSRIRMELLIDRERAGLLTDFR